MFEVVNDNASDAHKHHLPRSQLSSYRITEDPSRQSSPHESGSLANGEDSTPTPTMQNSPADEDAQDLLQSSTYGEGSSKHSTLSNKDNVSTHHVQLGPPQVHPHPHPHSPLSDEESPLLEAKRSLTSSRAGSRTGTGSTVARGGAGQRGKPHRRSLSMIVQPGSVRRHLNVPEHEYDVETAMSVPATPIPQNPTPPPIDFNLYATKKSVAEGLLVVALLTANAAQLKTIVTAGHQNRFHGFVTALVILSILLLVTVIVFLLLLGRDNLNDVYKQRRLDWLNNIATALIVCIVFINVFVSAFGIEYSPL
ncbi:uncharacterized protein [Diadema setosum]|uniref:uncharacterized protein n=1 Tax=Diadema setosum TaxID=31175 RepID=UPI003B3B7469